MPSIERIFHSNLLDTVNTFLDEKRIESNQEEKAEFLNIIDFIERFHLLPHGLFPAQKFIVKLYYNVPLDNTEKSIKITDKFNTKTLYEFTEIEYLRYLYDQGRCNIKEQDGKLRNELILCIGRRSGKSLMSSLYAAYENYKLLARGFPQGYYGISPTSEINTFCVANDKDQAAIVFNELKNHIEKIDFFRKSIFNNTQTFLRLQTENDRVVYGGTKSSIRITFKSSVAKGLRGRGTILLILDELAFFVDEGTTSAEQVYRAIVPSTATFSPKDPKNKFIPLGPSDGRIISISSPNARSGFFYKLYLTSLENSIASQNMLMVQAPTWEINPTVSRNYYEVEYSKDPSRFWSEFGAQFSDRVRGWIEDSKDLVDCIDNNLRPLDRGVPRKPHFVGFDLALKDDGSAIAITHLNNGKIELAYHEVWQAGKKWAELNPHLKSPTTPYVNEMEFVSRLDLEQIVDWIVELSKKFYFHKGVCDQWAGMVFEQALHKKGLSQFDMRSFQKSGASLMYQTFKMLMYSDQIRLYDYPVPERLSSNEGEGVKHSPLIKELLELQMTHHEKNIITVEAPDVPGKHDDMSDALTRSVLLASEFLKENPDALLLSNSNIISQLPQNQDFRSYRQFYTQRAKLHGIGDRRRIVPRFMKR